MKKILASLFLAASAFFIQPAEASDPRWGYFYLSETIDDLASGDSVDWDGPINGIQQIHSEGVYVNPDDTTTIVIKHPGTYLITYSLTVEVSDFEGLDDGDAQFALYLNDSIVYGSTYGTGNAFSSGFISDVFNDALDTDLTYDDEAQISGQIIIVVDDYNSLLSLSNHCENGLTLSAQAGTDDPNFSNNVSASILIHRIDKHTNCED